MQVANTESVLADFSDVTVPYFDSSATFSRRGEGFIVSLGEPDAESIEYRVTHTFGVAPLQQYLVDAPGGRKQALQFAWDSRPEHDGGQRWYHLYADEYIDSADPLHWTGRYFNWNYMCAECHSTNLVTGYDIEADAFNTSYSEVSVGCEACHGPGAAHVAQAEVEAFDDVLGLSINFRERRDAAWVMNPDTGIAERTIPNTARQEIESCGRCHARRSVVTAEYEYGKPLADTHMPALLEDGLYHADGRILEEVYVYGSFVQSKMYAAGVTCSDCHDPHSGRLRAGPDPNDTCATCHLDTTFASAEHGSKNAGECVTCHMPATTYMGVDDRRDHSFRLPGTDNDPDHYGAAIAAGRQGGANEDLLVGIANPAFPPIARATMLSLLGPFTSANHADVLFEQLDDPDPLVRIGALRALRNHEPRLRMQNGMHLLRDPVRSVRIEAALTYVDYRDLLPVEDARAFPNAADEYRNATRTSAFMPDAALGLAEFENRLGNTTEAARLYAHALRVGPDLAAVQHAYGLYRVRSGEPEKALQHLQRAADIDPDSPLFVYVYGVALNSLGQPDAAIRVLAGARKRFPADFDIGWALATIYRDLGDTESAAAVAAELAEQFPDNAQIRALQTELDR